MATLQISPNPNGSNISVGGGGSGEVSEGTRIYIEYIRKNYSQTQGEWLPKYGGGWDPSSYRWEGVVGDGGFSRICGYIGQTQPIDGSASSGNVTFTVIGIKAGGVIDPNTSSNLCSEGEWTLTTTNEQGETTTTTDSSSFVGGQTGHSPGWAPIAARVEGEANANFPIFETAAEAENFLRTGEGDPINGMVPVVQNDYDYYMYNRISTTPGSGSEYEYFYRYKMQDGARLCLYKERLIGYPQFDRTLSGIDGIATIYKGDSPEQDPFPEALSTDLHFLGEAARYEGGTNWYPITYETNIPLADTLQHAQDYIDTGDTTGITGIPGQQEGEIGEPTDTTEQGENGAVYSYGGGMFRLSNLQLASFYSEAFNTDPDVMQSILDGLQLFGSNQINAIHDVMYIPFDAEDVATLSSGNDIYLGSYKMTSLTGDRVLKNDKLINMGSHYFAPPYGAGDHRNYAPLCRIFVMLPYAGTHELQIDKYIGKNVTLKLAVDLTTGAGTYFVLSNNTIMDSFDCQIGAHRPITAVDHAQHVSAITNAILQTGTQGIKTVAGATNVINPAQAARAGREATKTSLNAAGLGGAVGGALDTVLSGYQAMQTNIDYPMTERGSFNGFLGMFDVKSPYFVFCQLQTKQAANLIRIKGKPSAAGGKLSSFFGYFEAAAVDLPSFSGTEAEAVELMSILKGGIYID